MSTPHIIEFEAGCPIGKAAQKLVNAAILHGSAQGSFNDIILTADTGSTPEEILAYWSAESDRRSEAYRNSPEGKAAAAEREKRRSDMQVRHDVLMRKLPMLDFAKDVAVLEWLLEMQEPSDHCGVIVKRETIVARLEAQGFVARANCGAIFEVKTETTCSGIWSDRRCLGLRMVFAIHPIIHKFAEEWRAKFVRVPEVAS